MYHTWMVWVRICEDWTWVSFKLKKVSRGAAKSLMFKKVGTPKLPSWKLTYPLPVGTLEYDFPFPQAGYVSLLQGSIRNRIPLTLSSVRFDCQEPLPTLTKTICETLPNLHPWKIVMFHTTQKPKKRIRVVEMHWMVRLVDTNLPQENKDINKAFKDSW